MQVFLLHPALSEKRMTRQGLYYGNSFPSLPPPPSSLALVYKQYLMMALREGLSDVQD